VLLLLFEINDSRNVPFGFN